MRVIIYISGILGMLLLIIGLIGAIADFPNTELILGSAGILILLVAFPLIVVDRYRGNKKIKNINKSYKGKPQTESHINAGKSDSKLKGWNMGETSLRERKSGLTWGGGNIKGANASRGTKRSFLKNR